MNSSQAYSNKLQSTNLKRFIVKPLTPRLKLQKVVERCNTDNDVTDSSSWVSVIDSLFSFQFLAAAAASAARAASAAWSWDG